jgi:elongation factor P--(R)-beta-lysine ligase
MWWKFENFTRKIEYVKARTRLVQAVREYFDGQDFLEVSTPALQVMPGAEVHVHAFQTEVISPDLQTREARYLQTSPEFSMKKLLVAGLPKIYQICPVYRNAEGSSIHSCEFTMLEWYRANTDYEGIMQDTIGLLSHIATRLDISAYRHGGYEADSFVEWEKISVCDAFKKYADINLEAFLPDKVDQFRDAVEELGLPVSEEDRWDDLFFKVSMNKVEPYLGMGQPTILYDYPAHMAALSKIKASDPRFAERFEVYVCGMELGNAFSELTNAKLQHQRMEADMAEKKRLYGETWPIDTDFIAALEQGMPQAGGIAIGIDRLAMLATGADDIRQVQFCD